MNLNFPTLKYFFSPKDRVWKRVGTTVLEFPTNSAMLSRDWAKGFTLEPHLGWVYDTDNDMLYSDQMVKAGWGSLQLNAEPITYQPKLPPWVLEARKNRPYTHYSGMVISKQQVHAPFAIQFYSHVPQKMRFLPGVWAMNDLQKETREIDFLEAFYGRSFYSTHSGGSSYKDRKHSITNLYHNFPAGKHLFRCEVQENHVDWYVNGVHIKHREFDSKGIGYHIICSLIVPSNKTVPSGMAPGDMSKERCQFVVDRLEVIKDFNSLSFK